MRAYDTTPRGNVLLAVSILFLLLVSTIVPARLFVRARVVRFFGSDDWAILFASLLSNTLCCLVVVGLFYGFGKHIDEVSSPEDLNFGMMLCWVTQLIFTPSVCITKISICLFVRRLTPYKSYAHTAFAIVVFTVTYTTLSWFFMLIQCHPFEYIYNKSVDGTCLNYKIFVFVAYMSSAANISTSFVILGLVVAMAWNVEMSRHQKYTVCGVLALGTLACSASIVKCTLSLDYRASEDYLYDAIGLALWSIIEVQTGIIAASIPTLEPLFRTCLKRVVGSLDQNERPINRQIDLPYTVPPASGDFSRRLATEASGSGGEYTTDSTLAQTPDTTKTKIDIRKGA